MKEFLEREIVVKRTVKGYIVNCIIISIVLSIIIFLGIYMTVNFIIHINPQDLVSFQQDISSLPNLALQTSLGIMVYILPILLLYMLIITIFMLLYENKNIEKKKNSKKTVKSKK